MGGPRFVHRQQYARVVAYLQRFMQVMKLHSTVIKDPVEKGFGISSGITTPACFFWSLLTCPAGETSLEMVMIFCSFCLPVELEDNLNNHFYLLITSVSEYSFVRTDNHFFLPLTPNENISCACITLPFLTLLSS